MERLRYRFSSRIHTISSGDYIFRGEVRPYASKERICERE